MTMQENKKSVAANAGTVDGNTNSIKTEKSIASFMEFVNNLDDESKNTIFFFLDNAYQNGIDGVSGYPLKAEDAIKEWSEIKGSCSKFMHNFISAFVHAQNILYISGKNVRLKNTI